MRKYLLSLLLVCVGFISFSSADTIHYEYDVNFNFGESYNKNFTFFTIPYSDKPSNRNLDLTCTISNYSGVNNADYVLRYNIYFGNGIDSLSVSSLSRNVGYVSDFFSGSYTFTKSVKYSSEITSIVGLNYTLNGGSRVDFYGSFHLSCDLVGDNLLGGSSSCDPQYTSEECQSEYSLVPSSDLTSCQGNLSSCNSSLSSCNSNLSGCMTNLDNYSSSLNTCSSNLNNCNTSLSSCMSSNCPVSSGNVSWSSLFINNIQHLGAPIIDITIPEEFDWDYVSTDEEFTLDIEGYNVDTEYMNGIITTQKTLPNDIDFNNLISFIVPLFVPGIVIIFFLYFFFKFIKKIF